MRWGCLAVMFLLALGVPLAADDGKADDEAATTVAKPPQSEVDKAVARGVKWLRGEQKRNGSFGTSTGETALALMALLHSGVEADDKACRRAASNLERSLPDGTVYGASLGIVALLARNPELHQAKIKELVADVVGAQCKNGQWTYAYRATARKSGGDNSNTQFAVLALGAARAQRFEVPVKPFRDCRKFLRDTQNVDGGYGYSDKERSRSYASMTAGGAMMLVFCLAAERGVLVTHPGLNEAPEVNRALQWLANDFDPARNSGAAAAFGRKKGKRSDNFWKHYWLWSLERACSVAGVERLGDHDWYAEGARHLLDTQHKGGGWRNPENMLRGTCFALLFFGRSTKRVITPRWPGPGVTPK